MQELEHGGGSGRDGVNRGARSLVVLVVVTMNCCGSGGPGPFSGRYIGTQQGFFGSATLVLDLLQDGQRLDGTWSSTKSSGADSGQLTGKILGTSISACLAAGTGTPYSCITELDGTLRGGGQAGTTISGSISYVPRPGLNNTFTVTKE